MTAAFAPAAGPDRPGRGVLLIVDDEPEIREVLALIAARCGGAFDVVTAADVAEAESVLRERDVRAVLTDLRLPGRSGLDLLLAVASSASPARCALMTGYQEDVVDGVRLLSTGVVGVLRKPFRAAEARAIILSLTSAAGAP